MHHDHHHNHYYNYYYHHHHHNYYYHHHHHHSFHQSIFISSMSSIFPSKVQQFDFHLPALTVKETLQFHAKMRLPMNYSTYNRMSRVNQVIDQLGLNQCSNTRVGDELLKGISGGEKRRLSLGIQLLADPAVCLLDEPTTGLDAFTARHVVETLKDIASKGRTIIVSIHQPRYDVFALLDDVILLSRGYLIWSGPSHQMLSFFRSIGLNCPVLCNPADFILDISSIDVSYSYLPTYLTTYLPTSLSM